MPQLLVGSRKGLFVLEPARHGWQLARPHFPGEPVTQVLRDPADDTLNAALRLASNRLRPKPSPCCTRQ